MDNSSAIMVKLPEIFGKEQVKRFKREVKNKLRNGRPSIVLDFSRVKQIDLEGLEALLECMEEVARQDGAFEVREISPEAATILELTRVNRLLDKFPALQAPPAGSARVAEAAASKVEEVRAEKSVQPQPVPA